MGHRHQGCVGGADAKTTVLLRVRALTDDEGLPLSLIASYLDRYGLRADKIRVTNRCIAGGVSRTWIGLTVSAADNLGALLARSPSVPLEQTARVAARRLADHLTEIGWAVTMAGPEDVPPLIARSARETWSGLRREIISGTADCVVTYRIGVDDALPERLAAVRSHPANETWIALEIACGPAGLTIAAACALRTAAVPGGVPPLDGLTAQHGSHAKATMTLNPLSTQRIGRHTEPPANLLERLHWPASRLCDRRQPGPHAVGGGPHSKPSLARSG